MTCSRALDVMADCDVLRSAAAGHGVRTDYGLQPDYGRLLAGLEVLALVSIFDFYRYLPDPFISRTSPGRRPLCRACCTHGD